MLNDFVKSLRSEGSFARNFTVTFSGNTLAVLIGFCFTPFIARVYTPEAYGFFAFFISLTQNITLIATLQLTRAFVLPGDEAGFKQLLGASVFSALATVIFTALTLGLFGDFLFNYFEIGFTQSHILIYLLPFSVLLYVLNDILKSWNVRRKFFNRNAVTQIVSSSTARGTTLAYGVLTAGHSMGLILGDLITKVLEILFLSSKTTYKDLIQIFSTGKKNEFFQTLKQYQGYPLYILPGVWLQTLVTQLPVYFALAYFDASSAGHYSFANSLLNLPVNILSGAIAPVFLQKAAETFRNDPEDMGRIVKRLSNSFFFTGLIPMGFLMVFADYIFSLVLGSQWMMSGKMASYMGVYYFFMMLNYPLSSLYRIYGKERLSLLINVMVFVLNAVALLSGIYYNDFMLGIALFSITSTLGYLTNIIVIFTFVGLRPYGIIFRWMLFFAVTLIAFYGIRRLIENFIL